MSAKSSGPAGVPMRRVVRSSFTRTERSLLAHDCEAIRDAEHHGFDAGVFRDEVVELAQCLRVGVLFRFVGYRAAPQYIVDDHQSAWAKPLQDFLVVDCVARFVGIDESAVEGVRGGQRLQRLGRGGQLEGYLVRDAGTFPASASDAGPFFIYVAAQEFAFGGLSADVALSA